MVVMRPRELNLERNASSSPQSTIFSAESPTSRIASLWPLFIPQFKSCGHVEAMYEIGLAYDEFGFLGPDPVEAFHWHLEAARAGHPEVCNSVSRAYESGHGIKPSRRKAFHWLKRSASLGSSTGMFNLGRSYHIGDLTKRDFSKARYWYKRSMAAGDVSGQISMALLYLAVQGVRRSCKRAKELLTTSLKFDQTGEAAFFLSVLHLCCPTMADPIKARNYLDRSSRLGFEPTDFDTDFVSRLKAEFSSG